MGFSVQWSSWFRSTAFVHSSRSVQTHLEVAGSMSRQGKFCFLGEQEARF